MPDCLVELVCIKVAAFEGMPGWAYQSQFKYQKAMSNNDSIVVVFDFIIPRHQHIYDSYNKILELLPG